MGVARNFPVPRGGQARLVAQESFARPTMVDEVVDSDTDGDDMDVAEDTVVAIQLKPNGQGNPDTCPSLEQALGGAPTDDPPPLVAFVPFSYLCPISRHLPGRALEP